MTGQIAPSSRISDIVHVLPDPIEYVSSVVGNFVSHGYDPETSAIRIGVTGAGFAPNYKIEEPTVPVHGHRALAPLRDDYDASPYF